jgi:spore coat polysaccharide biosynthesis protein SpsF
MGSSRLPGKVLMDVHGKPLLSTLIQRIIPSEEIDRIVVATTDTTEDNAIEDLCKSQDIPCYRGSDWDVLDRFHAAATILMGRPDTIIRICSDNPLLSYLVTDEVIRNYLSSGKEYFSNSNQEPDFLEDGFDVEVFSFSALEQAWKEARLLSEREHVCPYIKRHFLSGWMRTDERYNHKLSVDTIEDLEAVREIFRRLDPDKTGRIFGIQEVTDLLIKHPEIRQINAVSEINAGFRKTLNEDRIVK